ncbi:MAG: isochorismatase family protein [Chloroflexi bacterium]|nr:isochorismatase family protein [Chloroflexota bacterium]
MSATDERIDLKVKSKQFLDWLSDWTAGLAPVTLADAIDEPASAAICTVDMLNGFCYEGNLSSPRSAGCVAPIASLFQRAYGYGVRNFVSVQEWHSEHAEEFKAYGKHCVRDSSEALLVRELASLPFARTVETVHKNSLHTIVGTTFEQWLEQHSLIDTFVVTGVCTDLCTYDLALDLKLRANSRDIPRRVIVPVNCVNTYDLPVDLAGKIGALPHDGDLAHAYFLYMLALNKIEVVKEIV